MSGPNNSAQRQLRADTAAAGRRTTPAEAAAPAETPAAADGTTTRSSISHDPPSSGTAAVASSTDTSPPIKLANSMQHRHHHHHRVLLNPHLSGGRPANVRSVPVDYGGNHPFDKIARSRAARAIGNDKNRLDGSKKNKEKKKNEKNKKKNEKKEKGKEADDNSPRNMVHHLHRALQHRTLQADPAGGGEVTAAAPQILGLCQADCDADDECAPGLTCLQRQADEPVPGCFGTPLTGWDYCILAPTVPPTVQPTERPTESPSARPTARPVVVAVGEGDVEETVGVPGEEEEEGSTDVIDNIDGGGGNVPFPSPPTPTPTPSPTRTLDTYQPLRFHFNTVDLDNYSDRSWSTGDATISARAQFVKNQALPALQEFWSRALRVVRPINDVVVETNPCFGDEDDAIIQDPRTPYVVEDADLIIYVFADVVSQPVVRDFCAGDRTNIVGGRPLAGATACQVDQYNRPTVGKVLVCLDNMGDVGGDPRQREVAIEIMIHEAAHMLGFAAEHYPYYYDYESGLPRTTNPTVRNVVCADGSTKLVVMPDESTMREEISSKGVRSFALTTPTVVNVARNQFGCQAMDSVRLESQPTLPNDCFGSHWEEAHYKSEVMSALGTGTAQFLSPLTLALFEDTGWYRADYGASSLSPFGHQAGCDFVFGDCIVDGTVPDYARGLFCSLDEQPVGCSIDHRQVGYCDQVTYDSDLEPAFQYFSDPKVGGGIRQLDYCPTFRINNLQIPRENGEIVDVVLDCTDSDLQGEFFTTDFEQFGANSRCIEGGGLRPLCLDTTCHGDTSTLGISVGGVNVECEYDGQVIDVPSINGLTITCPRFAQICPDMICPYNCAGRGVCDSSTGKPKCVCFDASDLSPGCDGTPAIPAPTVAAIPAPTDPKTDILKEITQTANDVANSLPVAEPDPDVEAETAETNPEPASDPTAPSARNTTDSSTVGIIVGVTVSALVLLLAMVVLKRRQKSKSEKTPYQSFDNETAAGAAVYDSQEAVEIAAFPSILATEDGIEVSGIQSSVDL